MRLDLTAALIFSLILGPAVVEAQPAGKVPRLGFLTWEACPDAGSVFAQALRSL